MYVVAHDKDDIDIDDVEESMLTAIKHWYAVYKEPDGSPENNFGFDGRFMNKVRALCV